jgi:hypothetical protein
LTSTFCGALETPQKKGGSALNGKGKKKKNLNSWLRGDKYLAPDGEFVIYRHRDCGGRTEVQLVCDQCGTDVTAHDVEPTPGPGLAVSG